MHQWVIIHLNGEVWFLWLLTMPASVRQSSLPSPPLTPPGPSSAPCPQYTMHHVVTAAFVASPLLVGRGGIAICFGLFAGEVTNGERAG